jgi:hypothetical protein
MYKCFMGLHAYPNMDDHEGSIVGVEWVVMFTSIFKIKKIKI